MKKIFLVAVSLCAIAAGAQIPSMSVTTDEVVVTGNRSNFPGFSYYEYGLDTTLGAGTVQALQFKLDGDLVIYQLPDSAARPRAEGGKLITSLKMWSVAYSTGTLGKVMRVSEKSDTIRQTIDGPDGFPMVRKKISKSRTLWVSFTTKSDRDIWVPFSAGPNPANGNQFTTSGALSQAQPINTFSFNKKTYLVNGAGTLLYPSKDKSSVKRKNGNGRRWNQ